MEQIGNVNKFSLCSLPNYTHKVYFFASKFFNFWCSLDKNLITLHWLAMLFKALPVEKLKSGSKVHRRMPKLYLISFETEIFRREKLYLTGPIPRTSQKTLWCCWLSCSILYGRTLANGTHWPWSMAHLWPQLTSHIYSKYTNSPLGHHPRKNFLFFNFFREK